MSDLFHKDVPRAFIDSVFDTMESADWHTYQVLTKRSSLMARYLRGRYQNVRAPNHIWLGVSIEDQKNAVRLKHLKASPASTKFVSFEPLLASVGKIDLTGIHWAIVGGESGPRATPMAEEWPLKSATSVDAIKLPSFSNNGGVRPKSGGRLLRGREWNQYPKISKAMHIEAAE